MVSGADAITSGDLLSISVAPFLTCVSHTAHVIFSRSTDVTSTDLVSAKGKTKEVYCCDIQQLFSSFYFDVSDV